VLSALMRAVPNAAVVAWLEASLPTQFG
jgi:hypothetical protein